MKTRIWFTLGAMLLAAPALAGAPSPATLAWKFAQAVKKGGDATLEGSLALTGDQTASLAKLKGCEFQRSSRSNAQRQTFIWSCEDDVFYYVTDLGFDGTTPVAFQISTVNVKPS